MLSSQGTDPSNPLSFEVTLLRCLERLRFSDLCGWKIGMRMNSEFEDFPPLDPIGR